jgi:hypothetical protein
MMDQRLDAGAFGSRLDRAATFNILNMNLGSTLLRPDCSVLSVRNHSSFGLCHQLLSRVTVRRPLLIFGGLQGAGAIRRRWPA